MALRGVWQLKKFVVKFCDFSGSSRGTRDFIQTILPGFVSENPQLEATTELRRGRHPHIQATFANKNKRVVDLRNLNSEEVWVQASRLRNSTGRKVVKLKTRHVTLKSGIQGTWSPDLQL
eukprot:TRINITY_DN6864_c0_g1_i1.p1 TRINITY_DN6864_c0_g1~~TRINITY_DN6864_c0_g1_i1.p1  ORF type:complete len:131 (+),score=2.74 TRINITY_DN6864_c0_g1_i1:34-393(+)